MARSRGGSLGVPRVGEWAFLVGVLLAVVLGVFPEVLAAATIASVLVVLGLIVGLVNIASKEATGFLLASVALLVAGSAAYASLPVVGIPLTNILLNITTFVSPAAVIVALKAVYELARST